MGSRRRWVKGPLQVGNTIGVGWEGRHKRRWRNALSRAAPLCGYPVSMPASPRTSLPARWFLGSVGAFLIALGLSFTWWLWGAGERAMITRHWTPVPCTILVSGIRESQFSANDPTKWQPDLEYRYTFEGKVYHGTKLRRIEGPSPHRAKAVASAATFSAGRETNCFVNPQNPSEAVLEHASKAAFYTLWWPLLFAAGGAGMLRAAVRHGASGTKPAALATRLE